MHYHIIKAWLNAYGFNFYFLFIEYYLFHIWMIISISQCPLSSSPHTCWFSSSCQVLPLPTHVFVYASILQKHLFIIINCLFIIAMIMLNTEISFSQNPFFKIFLWLVHFFCSFFHHVACSRCYSCPIQDWQL